jgi:uncharacterized surface protein with fasciclin (FAS1) repeats
MNRHWKKGLAAIMVISALTTLSACGQPDQTATSEPDSPEVASDPTEETTPDMAGESESEMNGDIADTNDDNVVDEVASRESFSILVEALEAAGLTDALAEAEDYTVFAPTNEAFEALPEGTLEALLQPENQDLLTQVLTYHVIAGAVPADDVISGEFATLSGDVLTINADDGGVMVDQASVIEPDEIIASNGVVHTIDQVLLPPQISAADLEALGAS